MNHRAVIREAMRDAGITQAQLGERLGVRQTAISNTVNRDEIKLGTFVRILDALGYELKLVKKGATYDTLPGWWAMLDRELPPGTEVKEKFGVARIESQVPDDLATLVEQLSSQTCELCGDPGKLRSEHGWVQCRCDRCHNATREERRVIMHNTLAEYESSHRASN